MKTGMRQVNGVRMGIIMLGCGLLAWCSGAHSISQVTRNKMPSVALRAIPYEPIALVALADQKIASLRSEFGDTDLAALEDLGKRSMTGQALNPRALRVLGFVEDVRGNRSTASSLIHESAKQSRRNFGAQLWLIEEAIAKGDEKEALHQYHLALTTKPNSREILFPILAKAISNKEIATALLPYVKNDALWVPHFFGSALREEGNANVVADLLVDGGGIRDGGYHNIVRIQLFDKLAKSGELVRLSHLLSLMPDAPDSILSSPAIVPSSFDKKYRGAGWSLSTDADRGADVNIRGEGREIFAFANPGQAGIVATKPLLLQRGSYELNVTYGDHLSNPNSITRLQIRCASENGVQKPFAVKSISDGKEGGITSFPFDVGAECGGYFLDLYLAGGDGSVASEITLKSVELNRIK